MGKCNVTKINIHHNVVPKCTNTYQKRPQNIKIWKLLLFLKKHTRENIVLTGIAVSISNGEHIFKNLIFPECNNSHSSFVEAGERKKDLSEAESL